jgi:hypothetical protein
MDTLRRRERGRLATFIMVIDLTHCHVLVTITNHYDHSSSPSTSRDTRPIHVCLMILIDIPVQIDHQNDS